MSPFPLRTCSACAGDYEDPDRTAWTDDEADDEDSSMAESETSGELRERETEPLANWDELPGR